MKELSDEERAKYPIILSEYSSSWPLWYAEEKERLTQLIGAENIVRITHIGSTAVPGLMTKPTVDILLEIAECTDIEKLIASLPDDEYVCLQRQTVPTLDRVLFLKGYTIDGFAERVYHIHVRSLGDWDEPRFRDYLIAHPKTADAYAALKRNLKERFEHDRDGYTNAKSDFIKAVVKQTRNSTGMPEYEIQKAQPADIEEILRLQYIAYQSEAEIYNNPCILVSFPRQKLRNALSISLEKDTNFR